MLNFFKIPLAGHLFSKIASTSCTFKSLLGKKLLFKMTNNITLGTRQIARLVGECHGNISIKGRIHRWPGATGSRWRVPAEFIAERFCIALEQVEEYAKTEAEAKAKSHAQKLERNAKAKLKGSAR